MPHLHSQPFLSLIAGVTFLTAASTLHAIDLDGLVKNSPFGELKGGAVANATPGTLEFRGMYADNGVTYFSIYNSVTKQSNWVPQGEAQGGSIPFSVKSYDPDNESVEIDNGGQAVSLQLHQATVVPYSGAQAPVAAPAPAVGAAAAGGFNNGQPPSAEQIQAFRDEMRRRFGDRGPGGQGGEVVAAPVTKTSKASKAEAVAAKPAAATPKVKTPKTKQ